MSARTAPTRRCNWHHAASAISTTVTSTTTDDPLASIVTLPMPTLTLVFGGTNDGDISLATVLPTPAGSGGPAYCPVDPNNPAPEHPHRIELSIDSLPSYMLIEPIPVAIDPVGDAAYTAWVHNLNTNATGHSVVEALLLLKERIEFVYDDLSKRAHLTGEEKTTLQMLHTYIAPKKPVWV